MGARVVLAAVIFELVLIAYALLVALRERRALLGFVESAGDLDRLKEAAKRLPSAYRAPAAQFAGELARKAPLDETLAQAVIKTTNTSFGPPPTYRALLGFGIALIVLLPLMTALFDTASSIALLKQKTSLLSGARAFLQAKHDLSPAFAALHSAIYRTACLLSGLSVVGALHWWLNRAEAREARFVRAVLEASIIARPGVATPVGARLSELVAPDRSLRLPVLAFFAFFVAPTLGGWSILCWAAGVREANAADTLDVWPKNTKALGAPPSLRLPELRGGGTVAKGGAALTIARETVSINNTRIADLDSKGRLGPDWKPIDVSELVSMKGAGVEIALSILADKGTVLETAMRTFEGLHRTYGATHFWLLFGRSFSTDAKSQTKVQAGIPLSFLSTSAPLPAIRLGIAPPNVTVSVFGAQQAVRIGEIGWKRSLAGIVQAPVLEEKALPEVRVDISDFGISYELFMEILAAADSTCPGDTDCGVPGVGLKFKFRSP